MVSVLNFYSDSPSLDPAKACSFSVKFVFEKGESKQKEAGVGPLLKKEREHVSNDLSLFRLCHSDRFRQHGGPWFESSRKRSIIEKKIREIVEKTKIRKR